MRATAWSAAGRSPAQSIVEFALVLPLFLLVTLGVVEGALLVYTVGALAHAVQEGGRTAALQLTDSEASVKQAVAKASLLGLPPLNVPAKDVTIGVNDGQRPYAEREPGDRILLSASHSHKLLFSNVLPGVQNLWLTRQTQVRAE